MRDSFTPNTIERGMYQKVIMEKLANKVYVIEHVIETGEVSDDRPSFIVKSEILKKFHTTSPTNPVNCAIGEVTLRIFLFFQCRDTTSMSPNCY